MLGSAARTSVLEASSFHTVCIVVLSELELTTAEEKRKSFVSETIRILFQVSRFSHRRQSRSVDVPRAVGESDPYSCKIIRSPCQSSSRTRRSLGNGQFGRTGIGSLRRSVGGGGDHRNRVFTHGKRGNLSGGNQQKAIIARWLAAKPKVLILDEPTRGIDIGAKKEIYELIDQLAQEGVAILLISSELPEVINMSDRIVVMRQGRAVAVLEDKAQFDQENIIRYSL